MSDNHYLLCDQDLEQVNGGCDPVAIIGLCLFIGWCCYEAYKDGVADGQSLKK